MQLVEVYKCLCDETRLRILHLLLHRPLCVCHFQESLAAAQVKISKHLAYLREHGLVETRRDGAWIVYSLPARRTPELAANLKCLQDCVREHPVFAHDLRRMQKAVARSASPLSSCCESADTSIRASTRSRRKNSRRTVSITAGGETKTR